LALSEKALDKVLVFGRNNDAVGIFFQRKNVGLRGVVFGTEE
jgi:hypothetical protein